VDLEPGHHGNSSGQSSGLISLPVFSHYLGGFLARLRTTGGYMFKGSWTAFTSDLLMGRRHTDIVTVIKIWGYSFGVIIIVALVYFLLSKITVRR
jgi:hypothetical protein